MYINFQVDLLKNYIVMMVNVVLAQLVESIFSKIGHFCKFTVTWFLVICVNN